MKNSKGCNIRFEEHWKTLRINMTTHLSDPIHVIEALHACRNLDTTPFGFFEGLKTMTLLTTLFDACRKAKVLVERERERFRATSIESPLYLLMLR
jgi:hypothetical protein